MNLKHLFHKTPEDETGTIQHLVPHERGWAIRRDGAENASVVYDTKAQALERGVALARKQKTTLVIHGRDGRIQEQRNYG